MDSVQVKDKNFQIYIQEEKIISRVSEVAAQISRDLADKKPLFLAVLNGSFVFAADLMRSVSIPCEISFVRMSSYSGTQSTGKVKELLGLKEDIEGRTVVVVEDIIDSGLTMKELLETLKAKHPAELHVASLLVKPNNLKWTSTSATAASIFQTTSSLATVWTTTERDATSAIFMSCKNKTHIITK